MYKENFPKKAVSPQKMTNLDKKGFQKRKKDSIINMTNEPNRQGCKNIG